MANYLYFCPVHNEFEVEHPMNELLEFCPKCQEEKIDPPNPVKRLIAGGTTFVLQGGGVGWAKEGYK